jgi:streptogramin lyase
MLASLWAARATLGQMPCCHRRVALGERALSLGKRLEVVTLNASRAVREPITGARRRLRGMVSSFGVCAAVTLVCVQGAAGSRARAFHEFPIPTGVDRPGWIAVGPDRNLWFTETRTNQIGRVTQSGRFKLFALPEHRGNPVGIVAGPDGSLWFTESNAIGRITPSGTIKEFPVPPTEVVLPPPAPTVRGSGESGITAGPDGNLWFTEWLADKIGRITPSGSITEFQIPTAESHPYGITAGREGNLWFTEEHGDKIGRITPSGAISEFQIPTAGSFPYGITRGREGNLFFTEYFANKVGRITPSGVISEFQIPTRHSSPSYGITAGREGNLWFTEESANKIARITPSGTITDYAIPTAESRPTGITASPNGNPWFTELIANKVGRVERRLLGQTGCLVPRLKGKTLTRAKQLLGRAHCKLGSVTGPTKPTHKPVVVSQKPAAKKTLPSGAKVSLRLG